MKYQCVDPACKAVFSHPAKKTTLSVTMNVDMQQENNITAQTQNTTGLETYVCPVCNGKFFMEYDEPQPEISSVLSVDLAQVDSYLAKGYVVHELYARSATLIKKEVKILEVPA